jgi:hypothetical protein
MKVDMKLLRDELYLQIVEESTNSILSLVQRGRLVCDNFIAEGGRTYFCETCGYSQYVHLCKKILKLNLLVGDNK